MPTAMQLLAVEHETPLRYAPTPGSGFGVTDQTGALAAPAGDTGAPTNETASTETAVAAEIQPRRRRRALFQTASEPNSNKNPYRPSPAATGTDLSLPDDR